MYNLTASEITQLNDFKQFLKFEHTWAFERFISSPAKTLALFTGNQAMKTSSSAYSYVLRVLSMHPVAIKNVEYWECDHHRKFTEEEISEEDFLKNHKKHNTVVVIFTKVHGTL